MSKNEVTSSKNVKSQREKELDEEINLFRKRAKDWLQDINDEHRKETKQLIAENKELKDKISDLRKKLKEARFIKPKTTPPQVLKAEQEAMDKLQAENAGYKKANEDTQKELKEIREQNDLFFIGIRCHENMATKLKDKVSMQFGQLNQLRSQVKDPQIPESFLKEEIEEMMSQSVEEAQK